MRRQASGLTWVDLLLAATFLSGIRAGGDWPTYRHDPARSGYTAEPLASPLSLSWSYQASSPPQPAWPRSARMTFDRVFQPVIASGVVCFGSSADCRLYALDAEDGSERWTFYTDAPVRFAPACHNGRVYAVSDDGHLYCLDVRTGRLLWKKCGAPNDEMILGNGRIISRWPARGGPLVKDGAVYFTAGIWPSDEIFLLALEAESGRTRWVNDTAGQIYLGQPHGGAFAHSGISPQGYLAAASHTLLVPNGRAVPAAFRRTDGDFLYFHLQNNGQRGGGDVVITDRFFVNDGLVFDQQTGEPTRRVDRGCAVALPNGVLQATPKAIVQYRWEEKQRINRKGEQEAARDLVEVLRLEHSVPTAVAAAIVARDETIIGLEGSVRRISLQTSNEVWRANVAGTALGLAVSGGKLYVSSSQGILYCFTGQNRPIRERISHASLEPYGGNRAARRAAEEIVEATGVTNGYCLDLACGDGSLAYELAKRTQLHIVGVDADSALVARARTRLSGAGLYGTRVTVLQRDPSATGLPLYFANLVASGRSITEGESAVPLEEAARLQRPEGGILCIGKPGALRNQVRGPIEGAGEWTHQYASPANTLCSADERIRGPLGMLWFTDVDQRLVQRHGRAPAPLYSEGILYSEGRDSLVAVDAYNGLRLWEYALPGILEAYDGDHLMGTSGTGGNYALSDGSLYVRRDGYCLRLDAKTGRLLSRFNAPAAADGTEAIWGFIACEAGILYGSLANPEHIVTYRYLKGGDLTKQLTESRTLFALDAKTGEQKWRYEARHSIRQNTISVGAGCVVLIDRPLALYDRVRDTKPTGDREGELVALDAATGKELWRNDSDIYGTVTILSVEHRKVVMSYQPTRFRLTSEVGGRMTCFDLASGDRIWDQYVVYHSRPMLNDRTIYAEGGAWDLFTGAERPFPFKRSYGCGILAGSRNLLVFRSATLGYFDLTQNREAEDFGGIRPGCWINVLPVGGLVLAPDASAGCVCSYPNQAWVALRPDGIRPPVIEPRGGTSRVPLRVLLRADRPDVEQVRYTLDSTPPTVTSPQYGPPLILTQAVVLQARAFGPNNRASRAVAARFVIDPHLLLLNPEKWQASDVSGAKPPSAWRVTNHEIAQTANTLLDTGQAMGREPGAERPGTLCRYGDGFEFRNGEFSFQIQSSDNDTVGAAFRLKDSEHYYLWLMDSERGFRALAAKDGTRYDLLAANQHGYRQGQWYDIRIRLEGPRIVIYVNGQKDLEAGDARFSTGTIALYTWGNAGVTFRDLKFRPE